LTFGSSGRRCAVRRGLAFFPVGNAFFAAVHGGDAHPGVIHLWRERSEFDPPEADKPRPQSLGSVPRRFGRSLQGRERLDGGSPMTVSRARAVRRADRLIRGLGVLAFIALGLFLAFFCGNLLNYSWNKEPLQRAKARARAVDLSPLPEGLERWLPKPSGAGGDPWADYQLALLEFRAREKDFVALKLRGPRPGETFESFDSVELLKAAARRPPVPQPLETERQMRGGSLSACCVLLRREAERLERLASLDDLNPLEAARRRGEAENLLRSWLAAGYYLMTRRYILENIEAGLDTSREALRELVRFLRASGRAAEAAEAEQTLAELEPLARRLAEWRGLEDDDADLEVWVAMLERSNSPAVRLRGAYRLADAARLWWRFGESSRAIRVLRAALGSEENAPIRSALFDLLRAAETNEDTPALIFGLGSGHAPPARDALDKLF
jgi:hypothetical protein